jgi:8-amino-7-oxononanoate synthase
MFMSFAETLRLQLEEDLQAERTRRTKVPHPALIRFCDNDYLGLASHPALLQAAQDTLTTSPQLGAKAARLISGTTEAHLQLEQELATFKHCEASLLFPNGYMAALGALSTLVGPDDVLILDKLAHACLIDGAKLSGARLRVFAHNDLDHLESILQETRRHSPNSRILIVVESLYSMDGDLAPLTEIVQLKEKYAAWLLVDEAHSTGLFGPKGQGLCHQLGLSSRVEIQMGTLSKSFGVCGGFITGSRDLIQLLTNRSRSFLFTTAPPPLLAAAASAALKLIQSDEGQHRRQALFQNIRSLHELSHYGNNQSPIFPIPVGSETQALALSAQLEEKGFLVPAIRFPTVAKNQARLRLTLNSQHTLPELSTLTSLLKSLI